jgi:hypothetical protein
VIAIIVTFCSQSDTVSKQGVDACVPSDRLGNEGDAFIELTASMSKPNDALDRQSDALSKQTRQAAENVAAAASLGRDDEKEVALRASRASRARTPRWNPVARRGSPRSFCSASS